jgi:hypothetical protein
MSSRDNRVGVGLGAMDVSMNIQAIIVERASGRPMMSGFHGLFSLGASSARVASLPSWGSGLRRIGTKIVFDTARIGTIHGGDA